VLSPLSDEDLPLSLIRFGDTDTDVIPNGGYTAASTTSERAAAAIHEASTQLYERLLPIREAMLKEKATVTWKVIMRLSDRP